MSVANPMSETESPYSLRRLFHPIFEQSGPRHYLPRLTTEQRAARHARANEMILAGETQKSIATELRVSDAAVWHVLKQMGAKTMLLTAQEVRVIKAMREGQS